MTAWLTEHQDAVVLGIVGTVWGAMTLWNLRDWVAARMREIDLALDGPIHPTQGGLRCFWMTVKPDVKVWMCLNPYDLDSIESYLARVKRAKEV